MFSRKTWILGAAAFILGFILVLRLQTADSPENRDTRDIWALREDLAEQKMRTTELNEERREVETLLSRYEQNEDHRKVEAMRNALQKLKADAGLTEVSGQGIVIHVEPLVSTSDGKQYNPVTARLLHRLVNELNAFGAKEMAIGDERVIATTPIRSVNGQVYVNDKPIPDVPFQIKVLAADAESLHNEFVVSESKKDFAKEKLDLSSEQVDELTLPAYHRTIFVEHMQVAKEGS